VFLVDDGILSELNLFFLLYVLFDLEEAIFPSFLELVIVEQVVGSATDY
jgi:hypothetical protein